MSFGLPGQLQIFKQVASELSRTNTTCLHIHGFYVLVLHCFQRNPRPQTVLSLFPHENFKRWDTVCINGCVVFLKAILPQIHSLEVQGVLDDSLADSI